MFRLIEVINLVKHYGEKVALDGVSFSVDSGEVVGLLGLNGAGKSTTMNILTGYISATGGSVSIDGHDVFSDANAARRVTGYLPEQFAFYPEMRVNEYLGFCCDLKGVERGKTAREKHIAELCGLVGLTHMRTRMIRNLSKGYKQRVGFAQALVGHPKVLILDEPTVGLDPSQIIEIRDLIKRAGKTNTVIVSSHILSEIQAVCDRVIVIHGGRVIADDTPGRLAHTVRATNRVIARIAGGQEAVTAALAGAPGVERVRCLGQKEPGTFEYRIDGYADTDIRAEVFFALAGAGMPILYTYHNELSLEEAFLHLIGDRHEAQTKGAEV